MARLAAKNSASANGIRHMPNVVCFLQMGVFDSPIMLQLLVAPDLRRLDVSMYNFT